MSLAGDTWSPRRAGRGRLEQSPRGVEVSTSRPVLAVRRSTWLQPWPRGSWNLGDGWRDRGCAAATEGRWCDGVIRRSVSNPEAAAACAGALMSVFGDFIKLRREELRLDQVALARQLGVQQQTVSKWEKAKTVPKPRRIRELAEVLRVEVSDLMRYAGYLAEGDPEEAQANEPIHNLLEQVGRLTDDQLIVLIDQAWEEYRGRVGFSLEYPRRRGGGTPPR